MGKLFNFHFQRESFLGLKIIFFTYQDFRSLLSEIFVFDEYEFKNIFPDDDLDEKENILIIDGGSNIGMSILFFKKKYPNSEIISFEPDRKTFQLLKKNVQQNNFSGIEFHQAALSDEIGETDFYIEKSKTGSLGMSLNNRFEVKNKEYKKETVKVLKISDYIKREVDLLKVDIEGAEERVVNELNESGKLKQIKRMIIEFHYGEESQENNLENILTILKENGFETKNFSTKDQLLEGDELYYSSMIYARRK